MCKLNDLTELENRGFTAEEQETWNKMEEDINALDQRIDRADKLEGRRVELEKPVEDRLDATLNAEEEPEKEVRDANWQFRNFLYEGENRALQGDLDVQGGYTIAPVDFIPDLIEKVRDQSFMRDLCDSIISTRAESVTFPRLDTRPEDSTWQGEITSADEETAMAFGTVTLTPKKSAKLIKVSQDLIDDSDLAIESIVRDQFAYKFGITEEKAFLTGSATAREPLGVFTANAAGISASRDLSTGNSTSAIVADNLIRQTANIKPGYLRNATWLFHRDAVNMIRRLKDGNGQYLWQPGLTQGQPAMILGLPYKQSEYVPSTFETGLYVGILGDFKMGYKILTRKSFAIQRLVELYAATHQVGFIGRMRVDGMPVLEEAFTRVKLG